MNGEWVAQFCRRTSFLLYNENCQNRPAAPSILSIPPCIHWCMRLNRLHISTLLLPLLSVQNFISWKAWQVMCPLTPHHHTTQSHPQSNQNPTQTSQPLLLRRCFWQFSCFNFSLCAAAAFVAARPVASKLFMHNAGGRGNIMLFPAHTCTYRDQPKTSRKMQNSERFYRMQ